MNLIKKVLIIIFFVFIIQNLVNAAWCDITVENVNNIWDSLDQCLNGSALVDWTNATIENDLSNIINNWVKNISVLLWLLAVWSIVYGALLMTISAWDEEKIKKAKDVIKWWILGFTGLIFSSSIILLIVNVLYSIGN